MKERDIDWYISGSCTVHNCGPLQKDLHKDLKWDDYGVCAKIDRPDLINSYIFEPDRLLYISVLPKINDCSILVQDIEKDFQLIKIKNMKGSDCSFTNLAVHITVKYHDYDSSRLLRIETAVDKPLSRVALYLFKDLEIQTIQSDVWSDRDEINDSFYDIIASSIGLSYRSYSA